ncbi:MAG: hypothetical protein FWG69_01790 [Oscillospiraceae bacterium]|nr:hypothetical protein [Oscillospiraceae bacterium]
MKLPGWILTLFGGTGLISTLIVRDSPQYRLNKLTEAMGELSGDNFSGIFGLDNSASLDKWIFTFIDILFYVAVCALILGLVCMAVSCNTNENNTEDDAHRDAEAEPSTENNVQEQLESMANMEQKPNVGG